MYFFRPTAKAACDLGGFVWKNPAAGMLILALVITAISPTFAFILGCAALACCCASQNISNRGLSR